MLQDPTDSAAWVSSAKERSRDATVLRDGDRPVAALYMLGFVVECYAKAMCCSSARPVPKGTMGHDILHILESSGLRRRDLPRDMRSFAESRDVSLRYQSSLPDGFDYETLTDAGLRLATWCKVRLRRNDRRRRQKGSP
jgi:hypothetical protein